MTNHTNEASGRERWLRLVLWLPGLLVALGAAAATAHGLYEVARATNTPPLIAGLYPVITDGLALVAYAATPRLDGRGRRYAWTVVVLAAGLSGIAQAAYLAGASGHAPTPLRVVIGAWPAIAAAIVAHLLFLIGHADHHHTTEPAQPEPSTTTADGPATVVQPSAVQPNVRPEPVQDIVQSSVQSDVQAAVYPERDPLASVAASAEETAPVAAVADRERTPVNDGPDRSAKARASAAARGFRERHGQLPTVTKLTDLADVSRGTAGEALKPLRQHETPLHLITNQAPEPSATDANEHQQEANQ